MPVRAMFTVKLNFVLFLFMPLDRGDGGLHRSTLYRLSTRSVNFILHGPHFSQFNLFGFSWKFFTCSGLIIHWFRNYKICRT